MAEPTISSPSLLRTRAFPLASALLMFGVGSTSVGMLSLRGMEALESEMQEGILNVGRASAAVIPLETLQELDDARQEGSPEYLAVMMPLQRLLLSLEGVHFIYTARLEKEQVVFLVDSSPYGDHDQNGVDDHAYLMSVYDEAPAALFSCLREGRSAFSDGPYTDAWGSFYSGFWPLVGATGRTVACVGVDVDAEDYLARLGQIRSASMVSIGFLGLFSAAVFLGLRLLQRNEEAHERAREALVQRLQESNQLLVVAQQEAEAASQAKSAFLAAMSHEIRTPMHAVIGFNRLALDGSTEPQVQKWLTQIDRAANLLLGIINDILDVSKIEQGKLDLEQAPLSLAEMLDTPRSLAQQIANDKGLVLQTEIPSSLPWVRGDIVRLSQILTNLLSNAVKFTETGTVSLRVQVLAVPDDPATLCLRMQVQDTGVGMTEAQIARLGRPFEQGDRSISRRFGGTGLGLSISFALLRKMGATWSIESAPQRGTTITVEIPLPRCAPPTVVDSALGKGFPGARLLVAEDNLVNRLLIHEILTQLSCQALFATNGQEAVSLIERGEVVDMVLMDIQMPIMDGLEATHRIRQLSQGRTLPIIAFSANVFLEDRQRSLQAGMNDHLPKPFSIAQLRELMQRYLPRFQGTQGEAKSGGGA